MHIVDALLPRVLHDAFRESCNCCHLGIEVTWARISRPVNLRGYREFPMVMEIGDIGESHTTFWINLVDSKNRVINCVPPVHHLANTSFLMELILDGLGAPLFFNGKQRRWVPMV